MKKIFFLTALIFTSIPILVSCEFNNKKSIFGRITAKYNCSINYIVGEYNEMDREEEKFYKLILSNSPEINRHKPEEVASNVALMFYPYLEGKKHIYSHIIVIVRHNEEGFMMAYEYEYSLNELATVKTKIDIIQEIEGLAINTNKEKKVASTVIEKDNFDNWHKFANQIQVKEPQLNRIEVAGFYIEGIGVKEEITVQTRLLGSASLPANFIFEANSESNTIKSIIF